ncbi:hypothetical protein RHGRI_000951 [Rhododendron griersonianum]|uniref:Uncharacterized protein n=1 Tax=Rhododendron griersonianum TaxID=479676 RepID=A0AAV6LL04_9ERIC|nr:hypothetical protein RHGRI_000951 [Rhododendron griersonianum]
MSDRDTPSLPGLTFRAVVIGIVVTVILAQLKTMKLFEENVIEIPTVLIQLIFGFLVGRLMEAMLPTRVFQIPGIELRFSLNPERFNSKEHTLIYACAFVRMMCPNTNIHTLAININYFRKDIYWPVAYMATLSSYSIDAAEISGPKLSEMSGPIGSLVRSPYLMILHKALSLLRYLVLRFLVRATIDYLLRICGYRRGLIRLDHEIGWASQHMTGNGLQQSLYKMVLAASLYHIWLERNNRVFQGFPRDALALMSVVKLDIRSCLSLWRRVKRSSKNQRLCALWNISQAVFSTV